uniref:Uncharacterized protein n=1 Tax=Salarias fasciatus TaxID=181472 RepID=A0A672HXN9_SALFA
MCTFSLLLCCRVKPAPHVSQVNVLPLCTAWCVLSERLFTKALPHCVHRYGCSPVWTLRWHCSVKAYRKPSPHSGHLCGFSAVCTA